MVQVDNILVEDLFEQVISNPCLPYFFIDLINGNCHDFCKFIGINGEFEKVVYGLGEYVKRLKNLKSYYLSEDYSNIKDFLSDRVNLELVLIYFAKDVANLINLYPYDVLVMIYNYLNFNNV